MDTLICDGLWTASYPLHVSTSTNAGTRTTGCAENRRWSTAKANLPELVSFQPDSNQSSNETAEGSSGESR